MSSRSYPRSKGKEEIVSYAVGLFGVEFSADMSIDVDTNVSLLNTMNAALQAISLIRLIVTLKRIKDVGRNRYLYDMHDYRTGIGNRCCQNTQSTADKNIRHRQGVSVFPSNSCSVFLNSMHVRMY